MIRRLLIVLGLVVAAFAYLVLHAPAGPRSLRVFDPDRTAQIEVDMWKAYYSKSRLRLFSGLVTLTHEQYRYPWSKSVRASLHLARAASGFATARSNYEQFLPDLERAYSIARDWTHAEFDPTKVARAELAWWVARREPGQNSPERVGTLIAEENALLYGVPRDRVLEASILRARAGRLRDDQGDHADWTTISRMLVESYRALHAAVQ